jgi:hypothetical protein
VLQQRQHHQPLPVLGLASREDGRARGAEELLVYCRGKRVQQVLWRLLVVVWALL